MVELCESQNKFDVIIDGNKVSLNKTSDIVVNDDFNIVKRNGYRVNIIGFKAKDSVDESGISLKLKDFDKRYSIDANGKVYRVEFYKNDEFCFMSKVHFR
ncbi:MAG: M99 family metallo-carboxypeptidase C-terminal domain-containing protein [Sulfurimonas sp.]|uniref:M99 family metallo-carboxypeptidase C-terminal domain-containing protein n=1 Tax=Sulfurimonas sp. TaxID=2022749 RepID=UPI00261F8055|nr:M99 family metallo-carboxypeptidase C-terminal domain-containing protein [Sulfurimonas sp.]MDD5373724.1 M99 family metallo-carboxypeptidase C-terminal domain-containing protein [Sulfurimonas sp.]